MSLSQTAVLVFARAPVPGRCKTRLIARYGARGAAAIHCTLMSRTLDAALTAEPARVELWCEPDSRHGFFRRCRRELGADLRRQPRGDLGRKMALAIQRALRESAKVLIVGTDCPALSVKDLEAAARALDDADVVLQPAEDGGYVLIGARRFASGALHAIRWSSGLELRQTLRRLARRGLSVAQLQVKWDVDWPADVRRARRAGLLS